MLFEINDYYYFSQEQRLNYGKIYGFAAVEFTPRTKTAQISTHPTLTQPDLDMLMNEVKELRKLNHPNIVRLSHLTIKGKNVFVSMEYVPDGTLDVFMLNGGPSCFSSEKFNLVMCKQICAGMAYLEENNHVHCNLAANTCLVWEKSSDQIVIVKISGFGQVRELEGNIRPSIFMKDLFGFQENIEMTWAAPEVMIMVYDANYNFISLLGT